MSDRNIESHKQIVQITQREEALKCVLEHELEGHSHDKIRAFILEVITLIHSMQKYSVFIEAFKDTNTKLLQAGIAAGYKIEDENKDISRDDLNKLFNTAIIFLLKRYTGLFIKRRSIPHMLLILEKMKFIAMDKDDTQSMQALETICIYGVAIKSKEEEESVMGVVPCEKKDEEEKRKRFSKEFIDEVMDIIRPVIKSPLEELAEQRVEVYVHDLITELYDGDIEHAYEQLLNDPESSYFAQKGSKTIRSLLESFELIPSRVDEAIGETRGGCESVISNVTMNLFKVKTPHMGNLSLLLRRYNVRMSEEVTTWVLRMIQREIENRIFESSLNDCNE